MVDKDQQIAALQEEIAQLRRLIGQQNSGQQNSSQASSIPQRPADWGEGPDPGRDSQSSSLSVVPTGSFFDVVKDFSIDMSHLNDGSTSFVVHLATIKGTIREHLSKLQKRIPSFQVYINYICVMHRPTTVCFFFFIKKI
jgi:hypothetical protein